MNSRRKPKSRRIIRRNILTCTTGLCWLLAVRICTFLPDFGQAQTSAPSLVRINDTNGLTIFGEHKREEGDILEVLELKTLKLLKLQKSSLNDLRRGVSEHEVVANIGLPDFLVWKIRGVIPGTSISGKVAQVDGAAVYVNVGASSRVEKGQELWVYRGTVEIRDPDDPTKVWITWGRRVAKLVVGEVLNDNLSKARVSGDLDVELNIGDAVEPVSFSKPIAILPFVDLQGRERAGGKKLSEDLTTGLPQGGIKVVERTLLDKVLSELSLQGTEAFDPEKAQKIGEQVGAYAVLIGTLSPAVGGSKVNLRLVRVETGDILFATKQDGPRVVEPPPRPEPTPLAPANTQGFRPLFNGRDLTGFIRRNPRSKSPWRVHDGVIIGFGLGYRAQNDIYTAQTFWNFAFRCEFTISKGGNSGIVLRGRHEVGILDDYGYRQPPQFGTGTLGYGPLPRRSASRPAGQWQTLEITLIEHRITVTLNGIRLYENVEFTQSNKTGLDQNIEAPGPILLQGHTGEVRFRNLMIQELR